MPIVDLTPYLGAKLEPPESPTPGVLTIASSDCSGGAGIEADIKTITVSRCYAMTCIVALAIENSKGVYGVTPTDADTIEKILQTISSDSLNLKAIKVGLLPPPSVEPVAKFLKTSSVPIVLDPVLVANSGDSFGDSQTPMLVDMFKYCRVVTPNFYEAETILSVIGEKRTIKVDPASLCEAARIIGEKTGTSVLLKGGHVPVDESLALNREDPVYVLDVLYHDDETVIIKSPYIRTKNTHGTGCTLSSKIAANLALGMDTVHAIKDAIRFVIEAIRRSTPKVNGPINHIWQAPKLNLLNQLVVWNPELWDSFTGHDFFRTLNNGTLGEAGLHHFLVQDYSYLQVFLACHQRLQELALTAEAKKVMVDATKAVETELAGHTVLLKDKFGIEDPTTIQQSPALKEYIDFMDDLLKNGNFVDLQTGLIPCQFGFNHAAARFYAPDLKYDLATGETVSCDPSQREDCKSEYEYWLQEATAPSSQAVLRTVQSIYNDAYAQLKSRGQVDIERVHEIFRRGCELEYVFWDECYRA